MQGAGVRRAGAPRRVVAGVLGGVLLLAGCSSGGAAPAPAGGDPTTLPPSAGPATVAGEPAGDPAYAAFYDQEVDWSDCGGDGAQCADVTVPVDWDDPGGDTLDLAVVRVPARGDARGSLLYNPGGPGVSGVEVVRDLPDLVASRDVRDAYDLVGFDPRGVAGSEGVDCVDDAALDDYLDGDPDDPASADDVTPQDVQRWRGDAAEFAAACRQRTGDLLGHVGTASAARDVDVLRAVVGDERLTYLGASYGTELGATYADLFPNRVGRMVLDGGVDPSLSYAEAVTDQMEAIEGALRAYAADCDAREECPLRGSTDERVEQVGGVLDDAAQRPLAADGERDVPVALALTGVVAALYDEATWPVLDTALAEALRGDGDTLLRLADAYVRREPDGGYSANVIEANAAIACLDTPVDDSPEAMAALADRLEQVAPTLGEFAAYGELLCGQWPVPPTGEPGPLTAVGSAPILVVGTTGDPATPYAWSVALADQLDAGRLLTWEGEGHTAYLRGSDCVRAAVDAYLLDGVLPGQGATCT